MSGGVARIELDRALKFPLGSRPVPVLHPDAAESGVSFSQPIIQGDGLLRRRFGEAQRLLPRRVRIIGEEGVRVCQPGIGERVIGIALDRSLEMVDSLIQALFGALVPKVTS